MKWRPIESALLDGTLVRLKLSTGQETYGEYWLPPPPELDPEQECQGWAYSVAHILGEEWGTPTHWKPEPPQ